MMIRKRNGKIEFRLDPTVVQKPNTLGYLDHFSNGPDETSPAGTKMSFMVLARSERVEEVIKSG